MRICHFNKNREEMEELEYGKMFWIADDERRKKPYSWKQIILILIVAVILIGSVLAILAHFKRVSWTQVSPTEKPGISKSVHKFALDAWETPTGDKRTLRLNTSCYVLTNGWVERLDRCLWREKTRRSGITLHTPTYAEQGAIDSAVLTVKKGMGDGHKIIVPVAVETANFFHCSTGYCKPLDGTIDLLVFMVLHSTMDTAIPDNVAATALNEIRSDVIGLTWHNS